MSRYTADDVPDQRGKTFLVTGANSGIGFETARILAARGGRVLMGCRSLVRGQSAVGRIREDDPDADLDVVELELGDLDSVRRAAARVHGEPHLDVLINNAGVMLAPRGRTKDGFEPHFGINHLGHFALTGLLLPMMRERAGARIVTVSSLAHRRGRIDFGNASRERFYDKPARYSMSKLANMLFSFELQRRLAASRSQAIAVACHPGATATNIIRHLPQVIQRVAHPVIPHVLNTAAEGALPTLRAATDPAAKGGEFYGPAGPRQWIRSATLVEPRARARNPVTARRLWELSVELTGIEPSFGDD